MQKKSFIFGASTLGRLLFFYLNQEGTPPEAFVVDDAYYNCSQFCGISVIPYSQARNLFRPECCAAYVAIGYMNMNAVRQEACQRLLAAGYYLPNYIHPSVMNYSAEMGYGNLLFPGVILDAYTQLGSGNILYPSAMISHNSKIGSYNFFAPRAALAGDITVGDRNFFGLNCSVKNGVKIGDCCLIGASAYANRDMESGDALAAPHSTKLKEKSTEQIQKVMKR